MSLLLFFISYIRFTLIFYQTHSKKIKINLVLILVPMYLTVLFNSQMHESMLAILVRPSVKAVHDCIYFNMIVLPNSSIGMLVHTFVTDMKIKIHSNVYKNCYQLYCSLQLLQSVTLSVTKNIVLL